ncbi:MAG TPA: GMC family oxidoreductase N-terminal domain-containing protein [Solirubrobacteraceae bacterium]|jgi:choline dehydrogenase
MSTYDYVIVGAGSAGCVLAARLSEDPDVSVLLIEAGPPDSLPTIQVPIAFSQMFRTEVDWDYSTTFEPFADRRRIYLPRGKVLGGSSSINAMIYIRGSRADYDGWQEAGCEGWGFAQMLPYFKRAEDNERGASELHGAGGPLSVSDPRNENPIVDAFLVACEQAGHEANDDFNGPIQEGYGRYQLTQRDGRRCSTAAAYLHPAMERPNLTVETYMQVHRVLFEGEQAVGVQGAKLGELQELRAEREVILCAGAYNSPQLLMLSGIGSPELLAGVQLPAIVDLPAVGENLQDHPAVGIAFSHDEPVSLLNPLTEENVAAFFGEGRGPLTSNIAEAGGFLHSRDGLLGPDLQLLAAPALYVDEGLSPVYEHGFGTASCVLSPGSRGIVRLASADPTAKPIVLHNYYENDSDMQAQLVGLQTCLEICRQEALSPYTVRPYTAPEGDSEEQLRAYVRQQTFTLYHPAGTCRMGSGSDSVVDPELRVRGVEGLRVVDASVMPTVTRGNTNAPTIAIAERAADLIAGRQAPAEDVARLRSQAGV